MNYTLRPWVNRLPVCDGFNYDVFGIDWEGPEGFGRIELVMKEGQQPSLFTEGMRPAFVKELLSQLVDECIVED